MSTDPGRPSQHILLPLVASYNDIDIALGVLRDTDDASEWIVALSEPDVDRSDAGQLLPKVRLKDPALADE